MKQKTLLLTLLVILALVLGACTTAEVPEPDVEEPVVVEEVEEVEEPEPVEEEEEAEPVEEEEVAEEDDLTPVLDFDPSVLANENYRIALVVKNFQSAFWAQHVDGGMQAAEDLGVTVTTHAPEKPENIEEQIAILEDLITAGVDCIALAPTHTDAIAAGIIMLNEAGIPVVYDNTRGSGGDYLAYVGIDNYSVGKLLGEYVAEAMGYEGNLLLLEGVVGQSTSDLRSQGVKDVIAQYPNITLESQPANWSFAEASDITTNMLTRWGGQLDGVISAGAGQSEGAAQAIRAYGLSQDDVVVGSFDVTADVVGAIRDGSVDFTINQQPAMQAYYSIAACVQYLNGIKVPKEIGTPVAFVTLENLSDHWVD